MIVARTVAELRETLASVRGSHMRTGFVPTMGALHEGHLSLLRAARATSDVVVLSIFVNPLQFGPDEDLARYPRSEERDLELAEEEKVDVAFLPPVEEMYPPGASVRVAAGELGTILEGKARPGHFDGVCTVVSKLFNLVEPDDAFFGQKDAQQVAVLQAMVRDLSYKTRIVVCPTVREEDGLALSSRNAYLSPSARARALSLYKALLRGADLVRDGVDPSAVEESMRSVLSEGGVEIDYARVVHPETFRPWSDGAALLVIAAQVEGTRLIDNLPAKTSTGPNGDTR